MSDTDETSKTNQSLTATDPVIESQETSTEPSTNSETDDAEKEQLPKNAQHAIQLAREREKAEAERARLLQEELDGIKKAQKNKQLEEMTDADRYKSIAEEATEKLAKAELKATVNEVLGKYDLPSPLISLLKESPWAIPEIAKHLGDNPSWDDVVKAVGKHLPSYVETLASSLETRSGKKAISSRDDTNDNGPANIDAERPQVVIKSHRYTREEIAEIAKDPALYEKHRAKIMDQVRKDGGILN